MLFLQLILLLILLIFLGEPLRFLLSKFSSLFKELNILETSILNVYLGGLFLYVIALIPLHLFVKPVILGLTILFILLSLLIHKNKLRKTWRFLLISREQKFLVIRKFLEKDNAPKLELLAVFLMFLGSFWIQLTPLLNFIFGSIHDTSLHALMSQVLLENGHVPLTLEPYLPEGIVYPQGAHVIFAYATLILGWIPPKSVFYVTPLFNSLSVFGAYFLGRRLWNNKVFYLGLSFIFAFVSSWPIYITWGANPFVLGFPFFLICLGLLNVLANVKVERKIREVAVIGILFGYLAAISVSYGEMILILSGLWIAFVSIVNLKRVKLGLMVLLVLFAFSLVPLSPFLQRFIAFYHHPCHNIGVPADIVVSVDHNASFFESFQWIYENISSSSFLRGEILWMLVIAGLTFFIVRDAEIEKKALKISLVASSIFFVSLFLLVLSFQWPLELGFIISLGHQAILLYISIYLVLTLFNVRVAWICERVTSSFLKVSRKKFYTPIALSYLLLLAVYSPFLVYRVSVDPITLSIMYDSFAVTSRDDYRLMIWMKYNLSNGVVVLVNPYEPGLFIPSVSNLKIIYPFTASWQSLSYITLFESIQQESLNVSTYDLMQYFNITHVFVGSRAIYWWERNHKWNERIFLGNPNFRLVKQVYGAYLFEVLYEDPRIVFQQEFENETLTDIGWTVYVSGNGVGKATNTSRFAINGNSSLMITSRKEAQPLNMDCVVWVEREIYVWDSSNVTLSFYINATSGFHGKDTLAIIISNKFYNRSMIYSIPNGVYQSYNRTLPLLSLQGKFTFNISEHWHQMFNSTLPKVFVLEIVNYDADGVTNVVYVDSIVVTCGKSEET